MTNDESFHGRNVKQLNTNCATDAALEPTLVLRLNNSKSFELLQLPGTDALVMQFLVDNRAGRILWQNKFFDSNNVESL